MFICQYRYVCIYIYIYINVSWLVATIDIGT